MEEKADQLTLDSLSDVLEAIYRASTKWYNLGLRLGLQADLLDTINMRCQQDPETCLREMLKEWLKLMSPNSSWRILINALKSTAVGEAALAKRLAATHCLSEAIQSDNEAVTSSKDTFNDDTTIKATDGDVKDKDDNGEPSSPEIYRNSRVYSASCSDQQSSDTTARKDDKSSCPAFGCRCGKCSLNRYLDEGCPEPVKSLSSFPYLQTEGLNEGDIMILKGRLFHEYQLISRSFSRFNIVLCESLIDQKIPVKRLARVLRDLRAFEPSNPDSPLLRERFDEIKAANDIDDIFDIIADYVSFFSFHVTEHIVDNLGTQSDKQLLKDYKEELQEYCKRNIFECPSYSATKPGVADLVMKVEGVEKYNLKHLEELISHVSRVVSVNRYTLQLHSVEKGCVQLNFQIPHFVKEVIFPLKEGQREELKKLAVIMVKCEQWMYKLLEEKGSHLTARRKISTLKVTAGTERTIYNHGNISREISETRLHSQDNDCFLVRESEKHKGCLTLSVKKKGKINHVLIECTEEGYLPQGEATPFNSMETLISQVAKYISPCPVPASKSGFLFSPNHHLPCLDSSSVSSDYASDYESEDTTDWTGTGDSAIVLGTKLPPSTRDAEGKNTNAESVYTKIQLERLNKEQPYSGINQLVQFSRTENKYSVVSLPKNEHLYSGSKKNPWGLEIRKHHYDSIAEFGQVPGKESRYGIIEKSFVPKENQYNEGEEPYVTKPPMPVPEGASEHQYMDIKKPPVPVPEGTSEHQYMDIKKPPVPVPEGTSEHQYMNIKKPPMPVPEGASEHQYMDIKKPPVPVPEGTSEHQYMDIKKPPVPVPEGTSEHQYMNIKKPPMPAPEGSSEHQYMNIKKPPVPVPEGTSEHQYMDIKKPPMPAPEGSSEHQYMDIKKPPVPVPEGKSIKSSPLETSKGEQKLPLQVSKSQ